MPLISACLFVHVEIFDYLERAKSGSRQERLQPG